MESRALLTLFTVNSFADSNDVLLGDGIAADSDGSVTLRAAIQEANALPGADTIKLPAGTFVLALSGSDENFGVSDDLDVRDEVTITGAGRDQTIIDGLGSSRVFDVQVGVKLSLSSLQICNGAAMIGQGSGGAIQNQGSLTVDDVSFTHNLAAGSGGAISSYGTGTQLVVSHSLFENNSSSGSSGGGAIFNSSASNISLSEFTNNSATHNGGAIVNSGGGVLTLETSTLKSNSTGGGGRGGGLLNSDIATVIRSTISGNISPDGAGIANVIGGGVTSLTLLLTTLSGNSASNRGGGIFAESETTATITDCTIALNNTNYAGGGIFKQGNVQQGSVSLAGSILYGNTTGTFGADLFGGIASGGKNIIGVTSDGSGFVTNDLQGINPLIGPLQDNGGPTFTHALLPGSPAIEANTLVVGTILDQRLLARPVDADNDGVFFTDIGAYEIQPTVIVPPIVISSTTIGSITVGSTVTNIAVTNIAVISSLATHLAVGLNGTSIVVTDKTTSTVVLTQQFDPNGKIVFTGSLKDDLVTIDFSGGNPIPSGGIELLGGGFSGFGDSLGLINGSFDSVTHSLVNNQDGSLALVVGRTASTLTYLGITRLISDQLVTATRKYRFGGSSDVMTVADDGVVANGLSSLLSVLSSTPVKFAAPTSSLQIELADGADSLTFSAVDSMFAAGLSVNGGDGDDSIDATALTIKVSLQGGVGNDSLFGGEGSDYLNGNSENDFIVGNGGDDSIQGGAGTDILSGGDGSDTVLGQGGINDVVSGGSGNDSLNGGSGSGDMLIETGSANMTLSNSQLAGIDTDNLAGFELANLTGDAGSNTINAVAFSGSTTLNGTGGDDSLLGSLKFSNVLNGGAGTDVLYGGIRADQLNGDDGDNDSLTGSMGDDTLNGGAGVGDVVIESANVHFLLTNTSLTGSGTDDLSNVEAASLTGGKSSNSINASDFGLGPVTLIGGAGNDTLIGSSRNDLLRGDVGNDWLKGRDGDDTLLGGNDTLVSGADNDTLNGGNGDDSLSGGIGNDGLSGDIGNDTLNGNAGNDILFGGDANDTLLGGAGTDTCLGGLGDDFLDGQGGRDKLSGDGGNDVFVDSLDRIEDFALILRPAWVNTT